jgi:hypothetical protein
MRYADRKERDIGVDHMAYDRGCGRDRSGIDQLVHGKNLEEAQQLICHRPL